MTEARSSRGEEQYASDFNKSKERQKAYQRAVVWLNTFVAIGLISACGDPQINIPFIDKSPTPTPTKVPQQLITPTALPPTETPKPTPTKTPVIPTPKPTPPIYPWQLLTPEPFPTRPPTPTSTPTPAEAIIPAPYSEPIPTPTPYLQPTPEAQKTYAKPGQKLVEVALRVENPSRGSKDRSFDLEFQVTPGSLKNENNSVKTAIKYPKTQEEIKKETEEARKKAIKERKDPDKVVIDPDKSISEGAVFSVPAGGVLVRVVVDVPPGATPGCFDEIIYSLKSREQGANRSEIERKSLARNVCVEDTIITFFTDHFFDEKTPDRLNGTNRVISSMQIINTAVEQVVKLEIENCSFEYGEKEAFGELKNIKKRFEDPDLPLTLDKSIVIPHNTNTILTLYFTPKAGEKPSFPWNCTVIPIREFNKQSPKPEPK